MIDVVDLSRCEVCIYMMYHFLFVPLTFRYGISSCHYGVSICNDWQTNLQGHDQVLGVNCLVLTLLLGVATGLTWVSVWYRLVLLFSLRWNIFGAPLAIEALVAFF
ncbi:cytochrome ubiquinol oxidase subunit I [Vibrio lentus]|nr:cytochrome ubiquinol oxidase subunit I [Vibrio lentus]